MKTKLALASGALVLAFALSGCSSSSPDVVGTWGDTAVQTEPSLELTKSGGVTGTDGCNRLTGDYTVEGDKVVFGQIASTMMFCETVETWLNRMASATVSGDTMTVFDTEGEKIGTLDRAE